MTSVVTGAAAGRQDSFSSQESSLQLLVRAKNFSPFPGECFSDFRSEGTPPPLAGSPSRSVFRVFRLSFDVRLE